jgi:putative nucleotidyltransferase with HDIG domain
VKGEEKSKILSNIKSFPSMPKAAASLLKLLESSETDTTQVVEILRYEPSLTANILKLTNSAYFGLPNKIGSVKQAIVLLGWKRLVHLVLVSSLNSIMGKPVPGYDLSSGELWRHSIAVSVAGEGIIKELKLPGGDQIVTAALVHDLGKLVLGQFVQEDVKKIEAFASEGISFEKAERMVLGTDHGEIGAKILEQWAFPSELVMAVRWHHEPDEAEKPSVAIDVVHVANVLCLMMGIGEGREGLGYKPSTLATKRLGVKAEQLERVASMTLQSVNELCNILKMNVPQ